MLGYSTYCTVHRVCVLRTLVSTVVPQMHVFFMFFIMAGKRCSIDSVVELLKHSIVALFKFCDCFSQYEMMILSTCELVRQRSEEAVAIT